MILTPEEYNAFLKVHLDLLYFAGKKHNILNAGTSIKDFKDFTLENKFECREYFNEHPDILEEFIKRNQAKLSSQKSAQSTQFSTLGTRFLLPEFLRVAVVPDFAAD